MSAQMFLGLGLAMGFVFCFVLEKSRVFEPSVLLGQMRLHSFLMLRVFLSATATGLMVLAFLHGTDMVQLHAKTLQWGADILGGALLGCGITLARSCPALIPVQLATGCRHAWVPLIGAVVGALCFLLLEPLLRPLLQMGDMGGVTLDRLVHLPFSAMAVAVAVVCIASLVALERLRPWTHDLESAGEMPLQASRAKDETAGSAPTALPGATP